MLTIVEDSFGTSEDPLTKQMVPVRRFTFSNSQMVVQVITLGATITSIKVPNAKGVIDDVVLGFDDVAGYLNPKMNPYFGATVGRVANRIGHGTFMLNGKRITVSKNHNGKHTLHGGFIGFNNVHWTVSDLVPENCSLKLQHVSADGHEGFPGEVTATVLFQLTADNCFHVRFDATTTKPTPVNLTNHSYFNLAGHGAGKGAIQEHRIQIKADKITATDDDSIPNGVLQDVTATAFDFRELSELGPRIAEQSGQGFDDNFCVNLDNNGITVIAKAIHPKSGRWMEVASDQPGVQFYTGNFLPNTMKMARAIDGKEEKTYARQGAFCFETQGYPDAVNHENFPSTILNPGEKYIHNCIYKFGVNA
ncbi:galactose mutarotase [Episyrphus balteatus]|uniref:galactose mutarotase n=1 Tax=Episyrphus balteatus TaxID=286459 RepID=UPI0024863E37|nr:galactose mutarotase [Episyrphus balteatus]